MILTEIADFLAALPPNRAICGLDLGDKTIGIAVSDLRRSVATPIHTLRRTKFTTDATELLAVLTERNIAGIILGLPLNMDGSEGPRVQSTRAFARNLIKLTDLPISFWDERLSTVAAERALLEGDTSRKRRREVIDQVAAGYILQGVLDRLNYMGRAPAPPRNEAENG
ncbi:Holliday junction resolvase RuvX [Cypionkella sp. TWP1-2-1b2]|uniref:Holliday junction resolvase RuvX n=1 Tax=Cypionkella sp. TWP1-2-1b2 TaxID=2804675 RepID=UPI003CF6A80B